MLLLFFNMTLIKTPIQQRVMEKLFPLKLNIFILNINVRGSLLKSVKSCSILGEKPNDIYHFSFA